jgi:hypothetical protein
MNRMNELADAVMWENDGIDTMTASAVAGALRRVSEPRDGLVLVTEIPDDGGGLLTATLRRLPRSWRVELMDASGSFSWTSNAVPA